MGLVHLHVHTEWSLLDGMCKIKELIPRVHEMGQNAVAITDHGALFGIIPFYKECREFKDKEGNPVPIKPIIGMEAYVVPDRFNHIKIKEQTEAAKKAKKKMTAKQKKEDASISSIKEAFSLLAENDEKHFGNSQIVTTEDEEGNTIINYKYSNAHLLLLARTQEGYQNLLEISSESWLTGFYSKPRIDISYLKEHGKGIIATSACLAGEIPRFILRGRIDLAKKKITEYCEIFDEFYLEIQPGTSPEQKIINQTLIDISKETGIPLVATSDAHYIRKEDASIHDILLGIATDDKFSFDEKIYYLHTEQEMLEAGIPQEAIDNTQKIADKCNVELQFGRTMLPKIKLPKGYNTASYISKLCYDGLFKYIRKKKNLNLDEYKERLEYELKTIIAKGLDDYLLIVQDFLNWARKNNIYVGPGRGSAVGSLCSFLLGITTLDPIEQELMFERFINPDRPSFPDELNEQILLEVA